MCSDNLSRSESVRVHDMDVRIWRVSFFGAVLLTYRYVRIRTAGSAVCFDNRSGGRTPRTARRGWATRRLSARFNQRHPRPLWQTCLSLSSTGPATARPSLWGFFIPDSPPVYPSAFRWARHYFVALARRAQRRVKYASLIKWGPSSGARLLLTGLSRTSPRHLVRKAC